MYAEIDEFFRKKFRKLEKEEALDIIARLSADTDRKINMLEDKFWVWETIEEALRPHVDEMSEEEVKNCIKAFSANFKGSQDIWDYLIKRVHYAAAELK